MQPPVTKPESVNEAEKDIFREVPLRYAGKFADQVSLQEQIIPRIFIAWYVLQVMPMKSVRHSGTWSLYVLST